MIKKLHFNLDIYNDAENTRIGIKNTEKQTSYIVDKNHTLSQILQKEENGKTTYYIYGLGLIAQETEGEYLTYHYDNRGSTTKITDKKGNIKGKFSYDAYGNTTSKTGDIQIDFLYNGKYGVITDENNLKYMRNRYYSSELRRFINQDILIGSITDGRTLNKYAYVNGNPISYIDPFGLSADTEETYWNEDTGKRNKVDYRRLGSGALRTIGGAGRVAAGVVAIVALAANPLSLPVILPMIAAGSGIMFGANDAFVGVQDIYHVSRKDNKESWNPVRDKVFKEISVVEPFYIGYSEIKREETKWYKCNVCGCLWEFD